MKSRILGGAVSVAALLGVSVSAQAYTSPEPTVYTASSLGKDSVTAYQIKADAVGTSELAPRSVGWYELGIGQIYQGHFDKPTWNTLYTVPSNGVSDSTKVAPGAIDKSDLSVPLQRQIDQALITAPTELFGKLVWSYGVDAKPIEHIGGSYATRATELGAFNLPADEGIYKVESKVVFDRLNYTEAGYAAPTTDTYPQLTVRCENEWGDPGQLDVGTIMGTAISKKGKVELTGNTFGLVGVTDPDHRRLCHVRAFGYNEDESGFGGSDNGDTPQFKAGVEIRIYRVA